MQMTRCPVCHARIGLEALVQDEAGRELLGVLSRLSMDAGSTLVGYLGLFRSASRDLANAKALKLAKEVLALAPLELVGEAMRKTVDNLQGHGNRPLTNHNYLKKVLEDTTVNTSTTAHAVRSGEIVIGLPRSKTAQAVQALKEFGNE